MICQHIKINIPAAKSFRTHKCITLKPKGIPVRTEFTPFYTYPMKRTLTAPKTFRYFTKGDLEKSKTVVFVLHGYGQLAEFFIRKFELGDDYYIVAPEGMHRFYLQGSSGRVGASWMTSEDRESDISDNIQWLNALDNELSSFKTFDQKIILGFSQGGATAARWFYKGSTNANHLIMWASVFPPDLDMTKEIINQNKQMHYFVIGNEDEFYENDALDKLTEFYQKKEFNTLIFNGKHDIHLPTLKEILQSLG